MSDPQDRPSSTGWRYRVLRPALVAGCLILTLSALVTLAQWRENRAELQDLLSEPATEERRAVIRRVGFERTPHHAKLIVARTLVHEALTFAEPNRTAAAAQLPRARELAVEVLREQPNSWQASMFLGAATYLHWSLTSDRRLYTEAARWELPLTKAMNEARGKPEPRRFLATAYLETWDALSQEKRELAQGLLEEAFRDDPMAFDRLAPAWVEVGGEDALEILPDRSAVWRVLERTYAAAKDWQSYRRAHFRRLDALEAELTVDLDEADQRLRLGDLRRGRAMCLAVVAAAPRDGRFAPLVTRSLELYPPGIHGLRSTESLAEWLDWALELSAVSVDPFSPRVLSRLTDAIGDLEPPVGALAALIAGDAYSTSRYEKLAESKRGKDWASYLVAKASRWSSPDELAAAGRALEEVHRSFQGSAQYWLARQRIARANGDLVDLAQADSKVSELRKREWDALEWRWRGRRATLRLLPSLTAPVSAVLTIEINKAPPEGAVVGLYWNGTQIDLRTARSRSSIELRLDVEPKAHLLELRALAGGEVYPGRVRLVG